MEKYAFSYDIEKMSIEQFHSSISNFPNEHKDRILAFMRKAPTVAYTSLPVYDRLTGEEAFPADNAHSDGEYTWYESWIYHFEKYNIKLNDDFIQHALSRPE